MKKKLFIIASLLVILMSFSAFAKDYDGYIVKIKNNTLQNMSTMALFDEAALSEDMNDSEVVDYISDSVDEINTLNSDHMLVTVEDEETLELLTMLGIVESYEPNYLAELSAIDVTTNPSYQSQKWVFDAINANYAWETGVIGQGVTVAVIDSGVYNHDDLNGAIVAGKSFIDGVEGSDTTDNVGHGTFVSGVIAAQCNSIATVGLSFGAKIMPLKITDTGKDIPIADIISAVYYAADKTNCSVINLSLGLTDYSETFETAINYAIDNDIIVVAAAGNKGSTAYDYPASFPNVVSVANAKADGDGFSISSSSQHNNRVDIAAPGTSVTSLAISSPTGVRTGSGTSYAAPLVTAAAALAKSVDASITPAHFETLVTQMADSSYLTQAQGEHYWGAGMLDVERLLKALEADEILIERNGDSITVHNVGTNYLKSFSITIKETDPSGKLVGFEVVIFPLYSGGSKTISLAEYGFSTNAVVKAVYDHIPGDVDKNGKINIQDAICILRKNAGYNDSGIDAKSLDADGNGIVNIHDAIAILRYNAGYATELH